MKVQEGVQTGDVRADAVLRVVLAHAEAVPLASRDDVRDGIQSIPFNYRYLVGQAGLDSIDVQAALQYLHDHAYLRVDFGYPREDGPNEYGCHVWMRSRLEPAA